MRDLATGPYTDAQVKTQLRQANNRMGSRYELLDRSFRVDPAPLDTVIDATVEHSIERDHMGALTLTLDPFEGLRDALLRALIRPYFRLQMTLYGGGWAEWPEGAYLWIDPERDLSATSDDQWKVTLGDQCWRLSLAGPGLQGFKIGRGEYVTDVIKRIYTLLGYTDLSLIVDSEEKFAAGRFFIRQTPRTLAYGHRHDVESSLSSIRRELKDATDAKVAAQLRAQEAALTAELLALDVSTPATETSFVNWGQILSTIQLGIGYCKPHFDKTGARPIARPARDFTASPDHVYITNDESVLKSLSVTPDFASIGNRVIGVADNVDGYYGTAVADANDQWPNSALAQKHVIDYIDVPLDFPTADSGDALQAAVDAELARRIVKHKSTTASIGAGPAHEPYDLVGIQWTGDADFGAVSPFAQRDYKWPLSGDFGMTLGLDFIPA